MSDDVRWYTGTCQECQERSTEKVRIPPMVMTPGGLFQRCHIDTMFLPESLGWRYVVHACCSLTGYPEYRKLRHENAETLARFIFEEIFCRWGVVVELVTDNGTAFVAAAEILRQKYSFTWIRISGYNSQGNGPIERRHYNVREALFKSVDGVPERWPLGLASVFWAERVTISKATGRSPYYLAHGTHPLLPFDIHESTWMHPPIDHAMSTEELLALRARQLQRRPEDLEMYRDKVIKARQASVDQFVKRNAHSIKAQTFVPGNLVMVRNPKVDGGLRDKVNERYIGPMVVVRQTLGGSYIVKQMDDVVWKEKIAAKRLVAYRRRRELPMSHFRDLTQEEIDEIEGLHEENETDGGEGSDGDFMPETAQR